METPQQALRQEDFPQLQEPTLPSPPLPPLQVPTHSRLFSSPMPVPPMPPSQPCRPPGTFLMTPELLHSFASELTLFVATAFTQILGTAVDMSVLESAVSRIADRVLKQFTEKVQAIVTTSQQKPAHPAPPRAPRHLSAINSHPPLVPDGTLLCPPPPTTEDNSDSVSGTVGVSDPSTPLS